MDWITQEVVIGNHVEARDTALIRRHGFRALLSLDGSVAEHEATELGFDLIVALPLIDGAGNEPSRFLHAVETFA